MTDDLQEKITENASGPRRVTSDNTTVEQHSIKDQIAADQYLAKKAASRRRDFGIRRFKMRPPPTA